MLVTEHGRAVLCDFGLSMVLDQMSCQSVSSRGAAGTVQFMAPEIILEDSRTLASDVYAFGMTAYEVSLYPCVPLA